MKLWFEHFGNYTLERYYEYIPIQLGLSYHKHIFIGNKKFKGWKGVTITLFFFKWVVTMSCVDDYKAYDYKINYYKYRNLK